MSSKIYVGGLPYSTSQEELENLFSGYGTVVSAVVINDRETGRSKGFGFVEMANSHEANEVIANLDGKNVGGRTIRVNEAQQRQRPSHSGW